MIKRTDPSILFWAKVRKGQDCWEWTGGKGSHGYGLFSATNPKGSTPKQTRYVAHRYAFFLQYGRFPYPMGLHKCDNPSCVRPDHIEEGDQRKNLQDCVARGRHRPPCVRGEKNGQHVATDALVSEWRILAKSGLPAREIASRFGHARRTVASAINGTSWKHVSTPPFRRHQNR